MKTPEWVKNSIGYEIYPRSFYDSNNDGIGDIQGIILKLDYLKWLGVNLLWIGPFYPSPLDDNGYDVTDFKNVDPSLGTLEDIKELIKLAHEKDMKIMFDFILNHTSDQHPWFIDSVNSGKKKDYYIWREKPNNWGSFFEGSAWKYHEKRNAYYLKIFSDKMPDLNWENSDVQKEMFEIARFWLDLGVDGFRMDAIAHLSKDLTFSDSTLQSELMYKPDWSKFSNRDPLYHYLNKLYENVFKHYDCLTIGEVGGNAKIEDAIKYINSKQPCIHMVFNFDHCWCFDKYGNIDIPQLKKVFNYWITQSEKHQIINPIYWLNHDHPRLLSHYGNLEFPLKSGQCLAVLLLTMKGLPFIYNGEEMGMSNAINYYLTDYVDVNSRNYIHFNKNKLTSQELLKHLQRKARDHGHLPMQWDDTENAGFTKGAPYLKVNDNYLEINVKKQIEEEGSLLKTYKELILLRKNSKTIKEGNFNLWLEEDTSIFAYDRRYNNELIRVCVNLTDKIVEYPVILGQVLYNNYHKNELGKLFPYQALILKMKKEGND